MSNKELKLKGRVQNKHKTEAEWYLDVYKATGSTELRDDPFIPLDGELIIYDPDSVHTGRRIKIGDNVHNVVALPFYEEGFATETYVDDKVAELDAEDVGALPLTGGVMTGEIQIGQGDGKGIQLGTNGRINATVGTNKNATMFGVSNGNYYLGHSGFKTLMRGSATRPSYNNNDLALYSDVSGLATIDKVASIDTWTGDVYELETGEGISWREGFEMTDDEDSSLASGEIYHRVPIVAGNNVEFEVDEENQVVKINATGGNGSSVGVPSYTFTVTTEEETVLDLINYLIEQGMVLGTWFVVNIPDLEPSGASLGLIISNYHSDMYNIAGINLKTGMATNNTHDRWEEKTLQDLLDMFKESEPVESVVGTRKVIDEPEFLMTGMTISFKFTSNGEDFIGIDTAITGADSWGIRSLRYLKLGGEVVQAYTYNPSGNYGITHGWRDEAYKTLEITEEPVDTNASTWIVANTEGIVEELETENKTIVGAINELHGEIGDISTALDSIIAQTESILGGNS